MTRYVKFNSARHAETLLKGVLHRDRYPVTTRDALAAALEDIVARTLKDMGIDVVLETNDTAPSSISKPS